MLPELTVGVLLLGIRGSDATLLLTLGDEPADRVSDAPPPLRFNEESGLLESVPLPDGLK